jgi:septal ring factor EnvC (AmiA/AmiB activator)
LEILNSMGAATVVLSFVGAVFSYVVLQPLHTAITEMRAAVKELRTDLRTAEDRRQKLEIEVAKIDQRARSAHNLLDDMQGGRSYGYNNQSDNQR